MKQFGTSFGFALKGLSLALKDRNFVIEVVVGVTVVVLGVVFRFSVLEWVLVVLCIGAVLTAEAFNTALEELCDKFAPEHDPHIARIKDLSAAAVLITALSAMIVGGMIFAGHLLP
jgi:diacylglycerol kinase